MPAPAATTTGASTGPLLSNAPTNATAPGMAPPFYAERPSASGQSDVKIGVGLDAAHTLHLATASRHLVELREPGPSRSALKFGPLTRLRWRRWLSASEH